MLEALTGAVGESDGEIGGIPFTRLTEAVTDGVALSATFTWDGTTTILSGDTSEIEAGEWIRLDVDGQYFQVQSVVDDTSVTIDNPQDLVLPTGSSQSSKAVTTLPVESTLDYSDTGKVSIDGVVYYYSGKTDQSFTDIYYLVSGVEMAGVQRLHRIESVVYDRNRDRSALDLVRRAMLVDYAEGEDLNVVARNLGVLRLPFLTSDDQFREVVKAIAYNPKGTLYGLELALEGLVGAGNFSIYEDLINYPCEVFISLAASEAMSEVPQGAAYLSEAEVQPATGTDEITLDHDVVDQGVVRSVELAHGELTTETTTEYPSAQTWEPYPDATPIDQWTAYGSGEGTTAQIVTTDGGVLEWTAGGLTIVYYRDAPIVPESWAVMSLYLRMLDNGSGGPSATDGHIAMANGERSVIAGWRQSGTGAGAAWDIGFVDASDNFISGYHSVTIDDLYHEIRIEHDPDGPRRLYWDGQLIQTLDGSSFSSNTAYAQWFGYNSTVPANAPEWRMKDVRWAVRNGRRNYWAVEASDGSVAVDTRVLSQATITFGTADVGKGFSTYDSAATNAQGGNNNGRWLVEAQGGSDVTLIGQTWTEAILQDANPDRVTVPLDQQQFQYPDDLGKEIEIIGSELGNDGVYVIDKLLDPVTLTDIELGATPQAQKTNVCEVVSGSFASETDLSWRLLPNFAAETGLGWKLEDAGTVSGAVLTTRQDLPSVASEAQVYQTVYAQVLSAQLLHDSDVENLMTSDDPVQFGYWPFYLSDPLGYARTYLSSVTAAGVIPSFLLE
jgi:hypothetical protein